MIGDLETVLLTTPRSIGTIIPQVAIREVHTDQLSVTNHPVEMGAAISDHAFKMPAELVLDYGWSSSVDPISALQTGGILLNVDDVYQQLLQMQADLQPIDVVTKRRAYSNMMIRALRTVTDQSTNGILAVSATLQQVIIVQVATVQVPPKTAQAFPVDTAPPTNTGAKQLQPANQSILYKAGSITNALFPS